MIYTKPVVAPIGNAASAIQGGSKTGCSQDSGDVFNITAPAYESDE